MLKTDTITAQYLNGKMAIEVPALRREGNGKHITIHGATGNNLKGWMLIFHSANSLS